MHPDCVAGAEAAGTLLESLGHSVEPSHPAALDDPDYTERFIQRWTAGIAWNLDYWSRKTGMEVDRGRGRGLDLGAGGDGALLQRPAVPGALEYQQRSAREAAAWWEEGFDLLLTPTMGEPPTPLGVFEPEPGNPASPIFRSIPTAGFTALLELDRPAGDLSAAALERGRACRSGSSSSPPTGARTC